MSYLEMNSFRVPLDNSVRDNIIIERGSRVEFSLDVLLLSRSKTH